MIYPSGYIVPQWPAPSNIRALVTTRKISGKSGGCYHPFNLGDHVGDDASAVASNRVALGNVVQGKMCWLKQVHSSRVVKIDTSTSSGQMCDGSYTDQVGAVAIVQTADCLPILLCDYTGKQVMALHAGWRGLAQGIVTEGVAKFENNKLMAYLGPAISRQCFEVGEDVLRAFQQAQRQRKFAEAVEKSFEKNANGKYWADIYRLSISELNALGVTAIYGGKNCTFSESDLFYSFRRDGVTGRIASMIWKV